MKGKGIGLSEGLDVEMMFGRAAARRWLENIVSGREAAIGFERPLCVSLLAAWGQNELYLARIKELTAMVDERDLKKEAAGGGSTAHETHG